VTKQSQAVLLAFLWLLILTLPLKADNHTSTIHHIKNGDVTMQSDEREARYEVEEYSSYFIQTIQMGGFFKLMIKNRSGDVLLEVDDVNGIVPVGDEKYVYAVSSIYGNRPGLYLFIAANGKEVTLLKAKNIMEGYSNGADYFELAKYDKESRIVSYYFTEDPNKIDFSMFRSSIYLKHFDLDAAGY
jgi:hypothetical protein